MQGRSTIIMDTARQTGVTSIGELPVISMETTIDVNDLPEMEGFTVELRKDSLGLGITIAGYVCEQGWFFFSV